MNIHSMDVSHQYHNEMFDKNGDLFCNLITVATGKTVAVNFSKIFDGKNVMSIIYIIT